MNWSQEQEDRFFKRYNDEQDKTPIWGYIENTPENRDYLKWKHNYHWKLLNEANRKFMQDKYGKK